MPGKEWKDRRVLITGISGFVGSRLALSLIDKGAHVVGITRSKVKVPDSVYDSSTIYTCDICDYHTLRSIISYEEIDTIYHLAANAIVRSSAKDPLSTYEVNVMGTANLLEAARVVGGIDKIVVASSDKAYGDHEDLPYFESHPLQPKNTYDTSKACMDMLARSYAHNYDMPVIVTRCSNIYGPGDMNTSRLIPNTIKRALKGIPAMLYSDVNKMEREFIYIDDVVSAYEVLTVGQSDALPDGTNGVAFNIGGAGPSKIRDVVDILCKLCNLDKQPEVINRDPRFKEIQKQYIDAWRLGTMGWKPGVGLEEGLKRTVEWYTKYYNDGEYS